MHEPILSVSSVSSLPRALSGVFSGPAVFSGSRVLRGSQLPSAAAVLCAALFLSVVLLGCEMPETGATVTFTANGESQTLQTADGVMECESTPERTISFRKSGDGEGTQTYPFIRIYAPNRVDTDEAFDLGDAIYGDDAPWTGDLLTPMIEAQTESPDVYWQEGSGSIQIVDQSDWFTTRLTVTFDAVLLGPDDERLAIEGEMRCVSGLPVFYAYPAYLAALIGIGEDPYEKLDGELLEPRIESSGGSGGIDWH